MFNLVKIGERSGSGIPDVFNTWADEGLEEPIIEEQFKPDRTILMLSFKKKVTEKSDRKKVTEKSDRKKVTEKTRKQMEMIISKMMPNVEYKVEEVAEWLGVGRTRARTLLKMLAEEGDILEAGVTKKKRYQLK